MSRLVCGHAVTDLSAKEGVGCAEADVVGVLVGVSGALHAPGPHNHIVEPAVLQRHLSAPLLDQDAPKQVQDSCTSTRTSSQLLSVARGGAQLRSEDHLHHKCPGIVPSSASSNKHKSIFWRWVEGHL